MATSAKKKPAKKKAAKKKSAKKKSAAKKPAKKKAAKKKAAAKKPAAKKKPAKKAAKKKAAKKPAAKKKSAAKKPAVEKKVAAKKPGRVKDESSEVASNASPAPAISTDTLPSIFAGLAEAGIEYAEFELCDPSESESNLRAWLGGLPADGSRVMTFAQDGTGSYFGVWLRAEHANPETAPIVFLGSEGETAVLAKDARAFIEQLGAAKVFDGHRGTFFADEDEDEDTTARRERTASFAKQTLELDALREPEAIKAEAEAAWPDFQAWVDANNAHRSA
jgi:hypothetical protein